MFCSNCGTKVPEKANFCESCGNKTAIAEVQSDSTQVKASNENVLPDNNVQSNSYKGNEKVVIASSEQTSQGQTVIINQQSKSNGIGTAGFVLALIGLFIGSVPFAGWLIWFLGFLFSFIGVFKTPRGLSIAGLIISLIGIILIIALGAFVIEALGLSYLF